MGSDIHGIFQSRNKETNQWETIESKYEENRHYQLFAILAGVRNGFGFAGVKTGEPVTPISEPRGFPKDLKLIGDDSVYYPFKMKYYDEDETEKWLGDHSYSWLLGSEIISYFEEVPKVTQRGVISKDDYTVWEGGRPKSYSGSVFGGGTVTINSFDVGDYKREGKFYSHVSVAWESSLADECDYFIEEIKRLMALHGEIRFVFGFDS